MCKSFTLICLLCCVLPCPASCWAEDDKPLTGARVLTSLARQSVVSGLSPFEVKTGPTRCQIALVVDGTTSMDRELTELAHFLPRFGPLFATEQSIPVSMAIIIYRDTRSPSGPVVTVSDFTTDLASLSKKLSGIKVESGEPYFTEALDQGLQTAFKSLSWENQDGTLKRILIIGDAPPYADDHSLRLFHDADLLGQALRMKIQVDALLVNSGFPMQDAGAVGTSRDSAIKAAPDARRFLNMLTGRTNGIFLDLWQSDQIRALLDPAVRLPRIEPPTPQPIAAPAMADWQRVLKDQFASVRGQRPALKGLARWVNLKPREAVPPNLLPTVWKATDIKNLIAELSEALEEEPENPSVCLILANAHTLLATADALDDHTQEIIRLIELAHSHPRERLPMAMQAEIAAMYELHVRGDGPAALRQFEKLLTAEAEVNNPGCQLRAAWACLSLEVGAWPATVHHVTRMLNHQRIGALINRILVDWPQSVEARALQAAMADPLEHEYELPLSLFLVPRAQ